MAKGFRAFSVPLLKSMSKHGRRLFGFGRARSQHSGKRMSIVHLGGRVRTVITQEEDIADVTTAEDRDVRAALWEGL